MRTRPGPFTAAAIGALLATSLALPALAQQGGLRLPGEGTGWQARVEHERGPSALALGAGAPALGGLQQLRLYGDYRFDTLRFGSTGGLRLTGGLLVSLRQGGALAGQGDAAPTLPYAGVGYSSGWSSATSGLTWGFSADLGMTAHGLGLSMSTRSGGTGLSVDGSLRDLRLQPMLRLGMNLSF